MSVCIDFKRQQVCHWKARLGARVAHKSDNRPDRTPSEIEINDAFRSAREIRRIRRAPRRVDFAATPPFLGRLDSANIGRILCSIRVVRCFLFFYLSQYWVIVILRLQYARGQIAFCALSWQSSVTRSDVTFACATRGRQAVWQQGVRHWMTCDCSSICPCHQCHQMWQPSDEMLPIARLTDGTLVPGVDSNCNCVYVCLFPLWCLWATL